MANKVKTKKNIGKKLLKILIVILLIIAVLSASCAVVNIVLARSHYEYAYSFAPVEYEEQLVPEIGEDGYYTFVTDGDFKVVQLTDIHIGSGFLSSKKDNMAMNAVAAMLSAEKPDLVTVTGDIAYPIPFQSGTINNKTSAVLFADLMEQLGVYWAPVFGNHDTESFSYYTREQIGEIYSSEEYPHCLFQPGPEDVHGVGNYVINVKNTLGQITQSIFMIDSNDYTSKSLKSTITWDYDCIHADQVEWYKNTVDALTEENYGIMPNSIAFFHIPLIEMREAWYAYRDNGYQDTEDIQFIYGKCGEKEGVVLCSEYNQGFFDAVLEKGSTKGIFVGHDHLNNFSIIYKGVQMTYSNSVDYLAYFGISKLGSQRGCTVITLKPDGTYEYTPENYYQEKYQAKEAKEEVTMQEYEH